MIDMTAVNGQSAIVDRNITGNPYDSMYNQLYGDGATYNYSDAKAKFLSKVPEQYKPKSALDQSLVAHEFNSQTDSSTASGAAGDAPQPTSFSFIELLKSGGWAALFLVTGLIILYFSTTTLIKNSG